MVKRYIDEQDFIRRYLAGEPQNSLVKSFGISKRRARSILLSAEIEIRDRRRSTEGMSVEQRYAFYTDKSDANGCWPWTGTRNVRGYGIINIDRKTHLAHRYGHELLIGPIPIVTPCILHICDNPPCQNPEHWRLGTRTDNAADRDAKGRTQQGMTHWAAQLTDEQVTEIRRRYAAGGVFQRELAVEFGISSAYVCQLTKRTRRSN